MTRIIVFASGSGSNAENIFHHFSENPNVDITHILTNNKNAKVIDRAKRLGVPLLYFTKADFQDPEGILKFLKENADLIVLAGFLWKVPDIIVAAFPHKIVNIHPALLPKYGGKGMYGAHVHEAVVANNEVETGITIHYVNEHYDEGAIIFQEAITVLPSDTPDDVAQKVHQLEYKHFPIIIEQVLETL